MEALRVLLLESSSADADLIAAALEPLGRPLEIETVQDGTSLRRALERGGIALVLSEWSLPELSAVAALASIQEAGLDVPFIVVASTVGHPDIVEAMRAGARDCVPKTELVRLAPIVERELLEHGLRAERRKVDDAQRYDALWFRALIERSDDGIALADADARLLYLSPGAKRILGMVDENVVGERIMSLVHPDDRDALAIAAARVRATSTGTASVELRVRRPDGLTRWLEMRLANHLGDPTIAAVVGNIRDVTERKLATDQRDESELRFNRLWESGLVGIGIADAAPDGAYLEANDTLLAITGYTRDDLSTGGMRWAAMTPDEWQRTNAVAIEQLGAVGVAQPWEKEYFRKDGTRVSVLVASARLSADRNMSLVLDLTSLRAAESEQLRSKAALASVEAQLRQAQKMDAIGRLAGGIAHDFNNMLSVIISYAELALEQIKRADPLWSDIEEIRKAGVRAAALTTQLLMFSRQQVLAPSIVSLNDVLGSMDKMLRRLIGEDIQLAWVPAEGLGHVEVDRGNIESVVMNLVVNARDAMPSGGQLTVETGNVVLDEAFARDHVGVAAGPHVMIAVTDTGTGMDLATQARIFEPFFTTKAVGQGTGLGLSTVFGIVLQARGTVWVYSEPGRGTTFKVYLPRVRGDLTPAYVSKHAVDARVPDGTETVLLVENEEAVRLVAQGILERAGYRVITASSPADALARATLHAGSIDLLLTDVVLPEMDGPTLAARLAISRPDIEVLYMSGFTDDSIVRHGLIESAMAYLQKPLTPSSLKRKVREVLDGRRGA